MDTSPALCIFCGHDRDLTADTCPSCGRGWVDRLVTGARAPSTGDTSSPAPGAGEIESSPAAPVPTPPPDGKETAATDAAPPPPPDDGSDPPTFEENLHPPIVAPESAASKAAPAAAVAPATAVESAGATGDESTGTDGRRRAMTQHVVIGVAVVAVVVGWFVVLAWITGQDDEVTSVLPTTTTAEPEAGASDGGVSTTTSAPTTTTTVPPTTTTTAPTTTVPPIEPDGEPIPAADLALGAFALGPLDFGASGGLGRLVATFGQPDGLADAGTELGMCDDDTGFAATWGPLTAIFEGTVDEAVLVGYRLAPDGGHPAAGLATLSGLEVGATIADLEAVYEGFTVAYEDVDGVPTYVVVRTADDVTLLWGPYLEEGTVEGIYSPLPCDGGPVPST